MIKVLSGRSKGSEATEALLAFVQSLEMHGDDEVSIGSGVLDIVRAYMGERPCCLWKSTGPRLEKLCERGMVDVFFNQGQEDRQAVLARVLATGTSAFDPCPPDSILPELKANVDGFLHVPVKARNEIMGIFSIGARKKETRDTGFIQPLECLGQLIAMSLQHCQYREASNTRETRLQAEVQATTRELESTNIKLIDRVKELKLLYRELQKRVQELTQANRAKNEFLSIVSHELRTPLTSLTGFLCVLLEEEAGPLNDNQRKFLNITKQSAVRLNVLISDLLDISRIESGRLNLNMGPASLADILQKSAEGLRGPAENKQITLAVTCPSALPEIWGDPMRLQQVVDNLISNAIKFTDRGGRVDVSVIEKGDFLQVSVTDTGPGLDTAEQQRVFDMFYQADTSARRPAGGAGLGLAIARGIVSMHRGQLWVESEKGKGATFSFIIPRSKSQKAA